MDDADRPNTLGQRIEEFLGDMRKKGMSNEAIWTNLYQDLRRLAGRKAGPAAGMSPSSVVHEFWLRTFGKQSFNWQADRRFLPYIACSMQNLLIDEFRRRGRSTSIQVDYPDGGRDWATTIDIAGALEELEKRDARQAEIVRLINWAGCSEEETADILGFS